jgi:16S rRNA (cytosine1402-N4)-methyltransferase
MASHLPVLCAETVAALLAVDGTHQVFVDGTFGRGGHARALLAALPEDARLVVIDRDPQAIASAGELAEDDPRVIVCHGTFSRLAELLAALGITAADGILLDIGVSSPQLDDPERGFSFMQDGPLDMRMDPTSGTSAADWLNSAEEAQIADVLHKLGEERFARRIARAIVAARPLHTTRELAEVVAAAQPMPARGKHPATRSFQAVRMHVNNELGELETALGNAFELLRPGGRLAVITFHSLEDRMVKRAFRALSSPPQLPRHIPVRASESSARARLIAGPQRASARELAGNPRARSATLRVVERIS